MKPSRALRLTLLSVAFSLISASLAAAQTTERVPRVVTHEYVTRPRPKPLRNGLWTLSVMYVASATTAIVSPRSVDDYLFVPVAGPWLDLAHRERDDNGKYETLYKVLLVADGVIQAIGVAQIALALIFPETRLVPLDRPADAPRALRATPWLTNNVLGLRADGTF